MPTPQRSVSHLLLSPATILSIALALVWAYGLLTRSSSFQGGGTAIIGAAIGLLLLVPLLALWSKASHRRDDERLSAQCAD